MCTSMSRVNTPQRFINLRQAGSLPDGAIELIARRFAVLSEPARLRLVHALFDAEKSVNALAEETGSSQPNTSRHLQALASVGVVSRRREGPQSLYSICDPSIYKLCDLVCGSIEKQLARQVGVFNPDVRLGAQPRRP